MMTINDNKAKEILCFLSKRCGHDHVSIVIEESKFHAATYAIKLFDDNNDFMDFLWIRYNTKYSIPSYTPLHRVTYIDASMLESNPNAYLLELLLDSCKEYDIICSNDSLTNDICFLDKNTTLEEILVKMDLEKHV